MNSCLEGNLPFVMYRKPMEQEVVGIFQADDKLHKTMDFEERGFVFAPFNLSEGGILIRPDEIFTSTFDVGKGLEREEPNVPDLGKEEHIGLVAKGIAQIQSGNLRKVVLSRKMEVEVEASHPQIFKNLVRHYPNAFCYLFHHPKVGTWCGATPETLVRVKNNRLQTMSLAATLPFKADETPQWGQKEIEEQKMVSEYIGQRLEDIVDVLHIGKAESIRAGNLWHLKSEVNGTLFPETELRKSSHIALYACGLWNSYQEVKDFIDTHENYHRLFTGFWGKNRTSIPIGNLFVREPEVLELNKNKSLDFRRHHIRIPP
ncbi:MAG: chorismate-binding protein [Allomuricauda sp.]